MTFTIDDLELTEDSIWERITPPVDVGWQLDYFRCKHCKAKAIITKKVFKTNVRTWVGGVFGRYETVDKEIMEYIPPELWIADHRGWCKLK